MEPFFKDLVVSKNEPSLWVKRLILYEKSGETPIREISFRKGINVIWAHEPTMKTDDSGTSRSGHGVGKTSFCLLLRYCLCDRGKAIDQLRAELSNEFPEGGVAAVVSISGEEWSVFRPYAKRGRSKANFGGDISILFGKSPPESNFNAYENTLSEKLLSRLESPEIPATGQTIEWQHLLGWLARDQAARFLNFYHWREGEGSKLQRSREDPPILLRLVLGLLSESEASLLKQLQQEEAQFSHASSKLSESRKEPGYILRRIENDLRSWGSYHPDAPFFSDDLLQEGLYNKVQRDILDLKSKIQSYNSDLELLDKQIELAAIRLNDAEKDFETRLNSLSLIEAVVKQSASDLQKAQNRKSELLAMRGICPVCSLLYSQCQHVKDEHEKSDIKDIRDQKAFSKIAEEYSSLLRSRKESLESAKDSLERAKDNFAQKKRDRNVLNTRILEANYKVNRAFELIKELDYWSSQLNNGGNSKLKTLEKEVRGCKQKIDSLKIKVVQLQNDKSDRENRLSRLVSEMSRILLGEGSFGSFNSFDDQFPFKLAVGCEAFKVLSVLLGDFAVLLFSLTEDTAFPNFLLHDCPREADMSDQLYRRFLELLFQIENNLAERGDIPYQYFLTTTTPPPTVLSEKPFICLELLPDDETSLLFKRRFNSLRQSSLI